MEGRPSNTLPLNEWWCLQFFQSPKILRLDSSGRSYKEGLRGKEESAASFPLSAWTTWQTQTYSRGHLHTNATLSENSEDPSAAWSRQGAERSWGNNHSDAPCSFCPWINLRYSGYPQPREPRLALKPLVILLGSHAICPVYMGKKRSKVKATKFPTNIKELTMHGRLLVTITAPHGIRDPTKPWSRVTILAPRAEGAWRTLGDTEVQTVSLDDRKNDAQKRWHSVPGSCSELEEESGREPRGPAQGSFHDLYSCYLQIKLL